MLMFEDSPSAISATHELVAGQAPRIVSRHVMVLVLATSRDGGRSSSALDRMAAAAEDRGADVVRVNARSLPVVFPDEDPAAFPADVTWAVDLATAADVIVLGGPVFRSAISGFTRHTLEVLRDGLKDTVIVPVLGAGSARATLVGNNVRSDLIVNFGARPTAAVVVSPEMADDDIAARTDSALSDALRLARIEVTR